MKKISVGQAITWSLLAAGAALLFAPKKGKQLRRELKQSGKELAWEAEAKTKDFIADFKSAYAEADDVVQLQKMQEENRQKKLDQTIADIKKDLKIEQ